MAHRVLRGGGWFNDARSVRAACRLWYAPDDRGVNLGFRCAQVQESSRQRERISDGTSESRDATEPDQSE